MYCNFCDFTLLHHIDTYVADLNHRFHIPFPVNFNHIIFRRLNSTITFVCKMNVIINILFIPINPDFASVDLGVFQQLKFLFEYVDIGVF